RRHPRPTANVRRRGCSCRRRDPRFDEPHPRSAPLPLSGVRNGRSAAQHNVEFAMTSSRCCGCAARRASRRAQSGVVLFITLVIMVALSLAGVALIRSTDTGTAVTGNLAFKQASIAAIDRGVESAVNALWYSSMDKSVDHPDQNYYACVRNAAGSACIAPSTSENSLIPDKPDAITSVAKLTAAGLSATLVPTDAAGNDAYY